jgi:hypothetical protein
VAASVAADAARARDTRKVIAWRIISEFSTHLSGWCRSTRNRIPNSPPA